MIVGLIGGRLREKRLAETPQLDFVVDRMSEITRKTENSFAPKLRVISGAKRVWPCAAAALPCHATLAGCVVSGQEGGCSDSPAQKPKTLT